MRLAINLLFVLFLTGCAHSGIERNSREQLITYQYALVDHVSEVEVDSRADEAAAAGATIGFIGNLDGNSEEMVAGAIAGALVGVLFTGIEEVVFDGGYQAYRYDLSNKEQVFTVILRERVAQKGQCVLVKHSDKTTIKPTLMQSCQKED